MWQESALGTNGENICYEPDGQQRQSHVTDVRPMAVCGMNSESGRCDKWTWTNNVGGAGFLVYHDKAFVRQYQTQTQTRYAP